MLLWIAEMSAIVIHMDDVALAKINSGPHLAFKIAAPFGWNIEEIFQSNDGKRKYTK